MKIYKATKIIPSKYGPVEADTQWFTFEPSELDSTYRVIPGHFLSDITYSTLLEKAYGTDLTLTNAEKANEIATKIVNDLRSVGFPNKYEGQLNKAVIIAFLEACKYRQRQINELTAKVTLLEVMLHFKEENEKAV